jgi:hypothetical protein
MSTEVIPRAKLLLITLLAIVLLSSQFRQPARAQKLDPKAWGGNHVGQQLPDFVQGDECLFCHRNDIGPTWPRNAHALTVREMSAASELEPTLKSQPVTARFLPETGFILGSRHHLRLLKKSGYGKFAVLDAQVSINAEHQVLSVSGGDNPQWNGNKFADRCAGCHTTAVDNATKAFSEFSLDCYACHGSVDLNHTKDTSLVLLSKKKRNDAKVITSLCAQCHLRETKSKSTGLPFPNTFVAGDNLFQDLLVDWKQADSQNMNPGDRHVWRNVRDVVLNGDESITCLSCHQVHANTSIRHRRILRAPICSECHQGDGFKSLIPYTVKSALCEY